MRKAFLFVLLMVQSSLCLAGVQWTPLDENQAFTINDVAFSQQAVDFLIRQSKKHNPNLSNSALLKGLIENRLLHANRSALLEERHQSHAHETHKGGHEADAHHHDFGLNVQTLNEYKQLLNAIRPLAKNAAFDQWLLKEFKYDHDSVAAVLFANGKKLVSENLTKTQIQKLREVPVIKYQVNGNVKPITVWDVFNSANIHDRVRIRRADKNVILQKALEQLALKYQEQKIIETNGWTAKDLADLHQFVRDKVFKQTAFKELGIVTDLHHDAPLLKRFKSKVTEAEIKAYYHNNQSQYLQVNSVRARHITLGSQADADRVYNELLNGLAFTDAVKRYSLDEDKHAAVPGDMGLISKNNNKLAFREKLALIQPVGKPSTPYRMLDKPHYEIILVEEKTPELIPVSDKSVRAAILTQLAQQKAAGFVETLKQTFIRQATVVINQRLFTKFDW